MLRLLSGIVDSPLVSLRLLKKLVGHLTSTIQAVFPGPLHFRPSQSKKNRAFEHSSIPLSSQTKEELIWWRDNLEAWNGKVLVSVSPDLIIVRCLSTGLGKAANASLPVNAQSYCCPLLEQDGRHKIPCFGPFRLIFGSGAFTTIPLSKHSTY